MSEILDGRLEVGAKGIGLDCLTEGVDHGAHRDSEGGREIEESLGGL